MDARARRCDVRYNTRVVTRPMGTIDGELVREGAMREPAMSEPIKPRGER